MTASITVTVAATQGSAPREAGAALTITATGQTGTIGGGALEWEAMRIARQMLADGTGHARRIFPLGPDLGQCCGGTVTLEFSAAAPRRAVSDPPVWIWGAGHVGRAIAAVLAPFETLPVVLIDTSEDRMPRPLPERVNPLLAADMCRVVPRAPRDARHFIVTYSHALDLALCDALLRHGFDLCGLIGSATKWARFRKRLQAMGHLAADIDRITCPIGDPTLGKHPHAIALGVATSLQRQALERQQQGTFHGARDTA